ncbi:MAG TPA: prepilin-type N-terminal cleavage/methylation domain-containing protein [Campylobacterales bacterium]|nr:prepilin-type N-terminal cleavage/methylation domain-containing protein [Campylobacterales bacterium]
MKKKIFRRQAGFTLIELMIYSNYSFFSLM